MNGTPPAIAFLLADDHAVVREGYAALLGRQPGLTLAAQAADAAEAYQYFKLYRPDVVILDISLPGPSGLETITRIMRRDPAARILIFTMHQQPEIAVQAMRAGALGYVTKSSEVSVLLDAIDKVYRRQRILSPDIAQAVALAQAGCQQRLLDALSVREFEIWRMLAKGFDKEEIACRLHVSRKTVNNCHYRIKRKLNVDSDIGLVRLAFQMKIIDI